MRTRIRPAAVAITTAIVATTATYTTGAHAATGFQVYSGTGWKIARGNGVTHLGSGSWKVVFYDTNSRTQLTPYAKRTAGHLARHTGLTFTVTTTITKGSTTCPTGRVIIMRLTSTVTRSAASQCHTLTGAADGSRATFDTYSWHNVKVWGSNDTWRRKVVGHELGHSVGLAHPGTWTNNPAPLMRGDVLSGYGPAYAEWYTPQDIEGLKNLRANATKVPPPTTSTTTKVNGAQAHTHAH